MLVFNELDSDETEVAELIERLCSDLRLLRLYIEAEVPPLLSVRPRPQLRPVRRRGKRIKYIYINSIGKC